MTNAASPVELVHPCGSNPDGKVQRIQSLVFIDLKKASDRFPREHNWQVLRAQLVPEYYINIIYINHNIKARLCSPAVAGLEFEVNVGRRVA